MTTMDYLSTSRVAVGFTMDPLTVRSPRCGDKYGEVQPAELVDWFIGIVQRRRGAQQVIPRARTTTPDLETTRHAHAV